MANAELGSVEIDDTQLARYQLAEAEWIVKEKLDCVKLIEQYRGLYISAVFIAIGWILGQSIAHLDAKAHLEDLVGRPEIAVPLLIVPFLNTVFVLLMLDSYYHMIGLAKYQFLLGCALGKGTPVWRWELFKTTPEGSTRPWVAGLNASFGTLPFLITICSLGMPFQAIWGGKTIWLKIFWIVASSVATIGLMVSLISAIKNRARNPVSAMPPVRWQGLLMQRRT